MAASASAVCFFTHAVKVSVSILTLRPGPSLQLLILLAALLKTSLEHQQVVIPVREPWLVVDVA